jgi:hypothetical protein
MPARVVVIGSSNTDLSVRVPVLPSPGQTRIGRDFSRSPGGKGANQAVAARRAGAQVAFIAAVGNDPEGASAIEGFREEGIDTSHIKVVPDIASGVALIVVDDKGRNLIAVAPGANAKLEPDDFLNLPDHLFNRESIILISLEIPPLSAFAAATRGDLTRSLVVVNAAPPIDDLIMLSIISKTDILILNDGEAAEIFELIPAISRVTPPRRSNRRDTNRPRFDRAEPRRRLSSRSAPRPSSSRWAPTVAFSPRKINRSNIYRRFVFMSSIRSAPATPFAERSSRRSPTASTAAPRPSEPRPPRRSRSPARALDPPPRPPKSTTFSLHLKI